MIEGENNECDVEIVSESYDDSRIDYTERKKRSKERGPDKKPRTYRANSMSNLAQFNQRPEEFVQYLKDEKGVNIGGNVNAVHVAVLLILALVAITSPLWIEKLVDWYEKRKER